MTDSITGKWNARYAHSEVRVPPPAAVLREGEGWLPAFGQATQSGVAMTSIHASGGAESNSASGLVRDVAPSALDLACGRAGNAYWLAEKGFTVSAWDISDVAIADIRARKPQLLHDIQIRDVVAQPPAAGSFDVIVVTRFLARALCPNISAALKRGGTLYYQTFTQGLSNPDFLLESNELLRLFADLKILEYHEPEPDEQGKAEARLVARKL